MSDLFVGDSFSLTPDGYTFEIASAAGVIGRAAWRSVDSGMSVRAALRSLDRHWASAADYLIEDVHGVHQCTVHKSAGRAGAFEMQVVGAQDRLIGSAAAPSVGFRNLSPDIVLSDAVGTPVGRMTTGGAPTVIDTSGRAIAHVTIGTTRTVMGRAVYRMDLTTQLVPTTTAVVMGTMICWAVRFSS